MITPEQREARRGKLGSSQAAAVLGLDPYTNAADVFLTLTGQAEDFAGNENTERGNLLEPVLIRYAEQELGLTAISNQSFEHPSGLLIANCDAITTPPRNHVPQSPDGIIEAKSATDPDAWGEEGTDEVPDRVLVQVAHQFVCVPTARVCWVPVILPGFKRFDFKLYKIERNADLCAMVESRGIDFMTRYVKPRVMPPSITPSLDVLKRVRRLPGLVVDVADEIVDDYLAACRAEKEIRKIKDERQAALIHALGDAEGGVYSGGMVTYHLIKRKAYTCEATEYRSLKVKKASIPREPKQIADTIEAGAGAEAKYLTEGAFAIKEEA